MAVTALEAHRDPHELIADLTRVVRFVVPGDVRGEARHRSRVPTKADGTPVRTKHGRVMVQQYTDAATVAYRARVVEAARLANGSAAPHHAAVEVHLRAHVQVPASWSKRKQEAALAGREPVARKPDLDNVAKLVADACNGLLWEDDAQIDEWRIGRVWATTPGLEVAVRFWPGAIHVEHRPLSVHNAHHP